MRGPAEGEAGAAGAGSLLCHCFSCVETEVTLNHELSEIACVLRVKTRYNFPRACYLISSQCLEKK